jgi:hypothetical protein
MNITPAPVLAGAFVLLFGLVLGGAFLTSDKDLVRALAQGLMNILVAVASFYFGSSQGSQRKDAAIAAALNLRTQPPAAAEAGPSTADRAL